MFDIFQFLLGFQDTMFGSWGRRRRLSIPSRIPGNRENACRGREIRLSIPSRIPVQFSSAASSFKHQRVFQFLLGFQLQLLAQSELEIEYQLSIPSRIPVRRDAEWVKSVYYTFNSFSDSR